MESLAIPFKQRFQHASAERVETESVLVRARTTDGIVGLGEGCPRAYVTHESVASALEFFVQHRAEFLAVTAADGILAWMNDHREAVDRNPAAFCAIELALLNAIALSTRGSLESVLSIPELGGEFRYSAVLGARNPAQFEAQLRQYRALEFTDYKIKLFGDVTVDRTNLAAFGSVPDPTVRLRFDANNLWRAADTAIGYLQELGGSAFAVEEPLAPGDYDGCRRVGEQLDAKIILDESFLKLEDFRSIRRDPERWIINIRVSKMGGLFRSLAVAQHAREHGVGIVVGAQVGETSILTRAALGIAHAYRDILIAQEGAFGTYLLEHDVVEPPVMFGAGGILRIW